MSIIKYILQLIVVTALICGVVASISKLSQIKDNITVDKVISGVVDSATDVGDKIIDWVENGSSSDSSSNGSSSDKVKSYSIDIDSLGSGSSDMINYVGATSADEGDSVTFTVSLKDMSNVYEDWDDSLNIVNVVLEYDDTSYQVEDELGDSAGTYTFIMPACDVTIMIYIMAD